MDIFERFNNKFGKWYEGLFGGDAGELRPKDVLRKIITAMEDNRKEGFDSKIYVPNKYVLELAVADTEERDYLLSFLDEEELVSVLQRFMAQNHYHARGPLDFTIAEIPDAERGERTDKLRVRVRFEKGEILPVPQSATPTPQVVELPRQESPVHETADDLPTVAGVDLDDEPGTVPAVAWAALAMTGADGRKSHFSLTKPQVKIGRSRNVGNDLVLDGDGMVSKTHARLEREPDGRWTLYDLNSTNGIKVNGLRVEGNRAITDGDQIIVGATLFVFQEGGRDEAALAPAPSFRRARLVTQEGEEHLLASETLLGRAVTSDIMLEDPTVSTKHARIVAPDAATYFVEDLDSASGTWLNGARLASRERTRLAENDRLRLGNQELRFVMGGRA